MPSTVSSVRANSTGRLNRLPIIVPLVAFVTVALDQLTKHLVRSNIALYDSIPDAGFFRLVHTQNTGAAFGIFENATPYLALFSSIALAVIVWVVVSKRFFFLENTWGSLALGLAAGGTLGNLIDRVYYGFVTDFLKAGPWPAFNIADASMVTGMLLITFLYIRSESTPGGR